MSFAILTYALPPVPPAFPLLLSYAPWHISQLIYIEEAFAFGSLGHFLGWDSDCGLDTERKSHQLARLIWVD